MTQEQVKGPLLLSYGMVNDLMIRSLENKKARKFARKGWNGKHLYIQIHGSIPTNHIKFEGTDPVNPLDANFAYIQPFFVIVNEETKTINTWVPSVSDAQALDWYEVI
ncbi:hypothetical protein OBP_014 [Pseudomonas phage OBP]|uniref:hypothetical protein n=1 Tax=Pseudomonas phage OBP TaxID=1124849 RepID=UPI000240D60B|nr:hypothetical protein OBP_014 [Pseudomonas phage OBP]AEV89451.1 hypothetical protein OBP_014 [Pseudomonas phage OBP]